MKIRGYKEAGIRDLRTEDGSLLLCDNMLENMLGHAQASQCKKAVLHIAAIRPGKKGWRKFWVHVNHPNRDSVYWGYRKAQAMVCDDIMYDALERVVLDMLKHQFDKALARGKPMCCPVWGKIEVVSCNA